MPRPRGRPNDLLVVSEDPFNAETPLRAQVGVITPARRFYVRDHFAVPPPPAVLRVGGAVRTPLSLALLADLRSLPARSLVVTLECAGNGRAFLDPPVPGEPWRLGAVSTAEWTGVPLRAVLEEARVLQGAVEVLFRGADEGTPRDLGKRLAFERSLPLAEALHDDTLLAYAMNGQPLLREHGAPLRLIVPGWYGMASVKWLAEITALTVPFAGFYQRERYVVDRDPLRRTELRAVITSPGEGEVVPRRRAVLRGYCWSGRAAVASVEVSVDGGASWEHATLADAVSPYAWRIFEHVWEPRGSGAVTLLARARDVEDRAQPLAQRWTTLGYANNASQPVRVTVA